jgi:hypothetical protein
MITMQDAYAYALTHASGFKIELRPDGVVIGKEHAFSIITPLALERINKGHLGLDFHVNLLKEAIDSCVK